MIKIHAGGTWSPPPRTTPVNASTRRCVHALAVPAPMRAPLTDYKVRAHTAGHGVTRVLIDSTNGDRTWTTIGVSENIIEASWQALSDSLVYGLLQGAGENSGKQQRSAPQHAD
jgi:2-isopropylmalate synthase